MIKFTSILKIITRTTVSVLIVGGILLFQRLKRAPTATGRVKILDVPVDPLTMEETLARIEEFIQSGQPHHIFTADASGIMLAHENAELHAIINRADIITPDGAGVLLASRINGAALPERVSGVDLVERTCELASRRGYLVYLFGAAEGIADDAAEKLKTRYPGLTIVGVRNGFFSDQEEPDIVRHIMLAKPDILFVALGIPKQELFIRRNFAELGVPVMIGIGGSFDVISGNLKRAPRWMQQAGLEWLYRLLQQPARLPRLAALPRFVFAAWRSRKMGTGSNFSRRNG